MSKEKAKAYSANELAFIKNVANDSQREERLMNYAKNMKRSFGAVNQRWLQLQRDERKAQRKASFQRHWEQPVVTAPVNIQPPAPQRNETVMVVPARTGEAIQAYVLEEGTTAPTRGDKAATTALKNKLRPLLLAMKPMTSGVVHSLPILKTDRGTVRAWLSNDPDFKDMTFSITSINDNPKMVRVYRKA